MARALSIGGSLQVTPSDTTNLTQQCTQLWVGGAGSGDLALVCGDGTVCEMVGVVVGMNVNSQSGSASGNVKVISEIRS